jgi:hypothetical protein
VRTNPTTLLLAAAIGGSALISTPAMAVVSLTLTNPSTAIQQTDNDPCIIGGPSCQSQAVFPFTQISNGASGPFSSPNYTVGQISSHLGTSVFDIGIDVATTPNSPPTEALDYFRVFVAGNLEFEYAGPTATIIDNNPGNGFSDAQLSQIDLSNFAAGSIVSFTTSFGPRTDGPDSFFLIARNGSTNVPEPLTLALIGSGLVGIGLMSRRRA